MRAVSIAIAAFVAWIVGVFSGLAQILDYLRIGPDAWLGRLPANAFLLCATSVASIVGAVWLSRVFLRLKRERAKSPRLKFGCIESGAQYSSDYKRPVVVQVQNAQTSVANQAQNVTARVRFVHADGSSFTVTRAAWLWEEQRGDHHHEGLRPSVDLRGNELQVFKLWDVRQDDGSLWVLDGRDPVGVLTEGDWKAYVTLVADNAKSVSDVIRFTVLPEHRIQWGQPAAFLSRAKLKAA